MRRVRYCRNLQRWSEDGIGILAEKEELWYSYLTKYPEVKKMMEFLIKLPFRILFLPILLVLKILFWVCSGVLCMSEWMFSFAGTGLFLL